MKKLMVGLAVVAAAGSYAASAQTVLQVPTSWADNVTVKGDLRYRFETINDDAKLNADKDTYTRYRNRIRARLGAEAKCNDHVKAGIEIATGQTDPVSANQTIGDFFNKKDFRLNLAYIDYNPFLDTDANELHLVAGKMKNPFTPVLNGDLVWDPDLTPEGVALDSRWALGDAVTVLGKGGYVWIQERSDKSDTMLYAGQAAIKLQFIPEVYLTLGGSYYKYDTIQGVDVFDWEAKNNSYGNSTMKGSVSGSTTNKAFASEYAPVEAFAELGIWAIKGLPITLYGQYVTNPKADEFKTGYQAGISLGKAKNPGTFEVGYSYAQLDKDAVVGAFTDSDRWGGGTDGKGHKMYAKYQFLKNLQGAVAYFIDTKPNSDASKEQDYQRLQVDLVAAF